MFEIIKTFRVTGYGMLKLGGGGKRTILNPLKLSTLCVTSCCGTLWQSVTLGNLVVLIRLSVVQISTNQSFWDKHSATLIFLLPSYGCITKRMKCSAFREELAPLRRLQPRWVLAMRIYFCRGPACRSGTCHLQNVPLDHLFLLILWVSERQRGKGRHGVINAHIGGYLLDSV